MIYLVASIITIAFALIEGVSYRGFILAHLGVSANYIYLASIFLSLFRVPIFPLLARLLRGAAYLSIVIYFALIFAEVLTYPNFVFTTFHVNPLTFQFFLALLWFHTLIMSRTNWLKSFLLAVLIYVAADAAGRTLAVISRGVGKIAADPTATYSEKMTKVYPSFYPAMQAVARLTPSDATIVIPPQGNPWELEGNGAMVTYFLYPRKVRNLAEGEDIAGINSPNTYLLIAKGSWQRTGSVDYGWPKVPIAADKIWQIDIRSNTTTQFARSYDPQIDAWDWGLIEVKHE